MRHLCVELKGELSNEIAECYKPNKTVINASIVFMFRYVGLIELQLPDRVDRAPVSDPTRQI
jgi:hypothetical protein